MTKREVKSKQGRRRLHRRLARRLGYFIKRHILVWYAVTALIYFAMIPFTVIVYPATTEGLTVIVLVGGFTTAIASLASALPDYDE